MINCKLCKTINKVCEMDYYVFIINNNNILIYCIVFEYYQVFHIAIRSSLLEENTFTQGQKC